LVHRAVVCVGAGDRRREARQRYASTPSTSRQLRAFTSPCCCFHPHSLRACLARVHRHRRHSRHRHSVSRCVRRPLLAAKSGRGDQGCRTTPGVRTVVTAGTRQTHQRAVKGEPLARETASKTDETILSWPHNARAVGSAQCGGDWKHHTCSPSVSEVRIILRAVGMPAERLLPRGTQPLSRLSAQLKDVRSKRFFSSLVLAAVATALYRYQLGIVGDQSRPRGEFIA